MSKVRDQLIKRLVREAEVMIQGSFSRTKRRCGNPRCRCHRGELHGPHTYLTFKSPEGRSRSLYVPKVEEAQFEEAMAAWRRFWDMAVELARGNREEMVRRRKARKRRHSDAGKA